MTGLVIHRCPKCAYELQATLNATVTHRCPSPVTGKPNTGPLNVLRPVALEEAS